MKKILPVILAIIVIVAVGLIYVFTRHTHTFSEATCDTASICECGEIQGEALGHTWSDATCESAKTCSVCGKVDREPLGHTWSDATCESAMTCSVCNATEGSPLEHQWLDATTENPKTCELCGLTEGEPTNPEEPVAEEPVVEEPVVEDNSFKLADSDIETLRALGATDTEINAVKSQADLNDLVGKLMDKMMNSSSSGGSSDGGGSGSTGGDTTSEVTDTGLPAFDLGNPEDTLPGSM